jgi:mono/diheme cytochrome c family protein
MAKFAITLGTVAILAAGVVPQRQQQPAGAPPAQTPAPAPQTPAPAAPNQAGRGRGGLDAEIAAGADFSAKPPVTRLTAEEEQKHFLLPPGFKIEPVLTDPLIEDPVGVTFDANGRMYVLEMRSYMRDADGINSREPISRISRHEDTNGDGTFDKHTIFADKLIMPRMAFPLQDGVILTLETDNRDMYKLTDTDGDGVADKRELFYQNVGRVTNMEWQPGGLTWALDNWLYMTYNPFRLRLMPDGKILREETDANGGQWWSAQDNYGKMWWVDGGGEIGPVNFQTPIASGVQIYRGHRLPQDMIGDLFFTEPVGRIVRRAKVVVTEGLTQLRNAYPKSEFIRSTDPLFRPVCITNAPDGTLYLMDMYTGIIQDSQFVGPYLRGKATQYGLDKQHNWGRIWRITYEGTTPDRQRPRMYADTPAQLVKQLEHANGWWRDTAQEQLVLRQDRSVVPALQTMARSSSNQLARIHALWTLEGLGALDATLVRDQMKDKDPKIRIQAIRASETPYKAGDKSFADDYRAMLKDGDTDVVIQAMLTLNLQKVPQYAELIRATSETATARGIKELGGQILRPRTGSQGQPASLADNAVNGLNFSVDDRRVLRRGDGTYKELCISCHGPDGQGAPMAGAPAGSTLAPPLTKSPRATGYRDNVIKILLNGLSGDVDGKSYPGGVMPPMGTNTDEWIADIASYVRNSFGNSESLVTPAHVAAVRAANTRKEPWTIEDLAKTTPTLLTNYSEWKATASHNPDTAANGLNGTGTTRWESGVPQEPGMWFQIELPRAVTVAEMLVDTVVGGRGGFNFGRGGRSGNTVPALGFGGYKVQVSMDGTKWSDPVAEASGLNPINPTTVIALKPVQARFIRITQTATPGNQFQFGWGIQRVRIFGM